MQLIYRGATYAFQPSEVVPVKAPVTVTHKLIYRGHTYDYQMPIMRGKRTPKIVNWRFSAPCEESGIGTLQPQQA